MISKNLKKIIRKSKKQPQMPEQQLLQSLIFPRVFLKLQNWVNFTSIFLHLKVFSVFIIIN